MYTVSGNNVGKKTTMDYDIKSILVMVFEAFITRTGKITYRN